MGKRAAYVSVAVHHGDTVVVELSGLCGGEAVGDGAEDGGDEEGETHFDVSLKL